MAIRRDQQLPYGSKAPQERERITSSQGDG